MSRRRLTSRAAVMLPALVALFLAGLTGPVRADAANYVVETCRAVTGAGVGPVPLNVSSGRFSAETKCRLGSGGQIGFRLSPTNQGSGQVARQGEWAALQWTIPSGVSMVRTWTEVGGTSANGTGRGFGTDVKPWMLRTFGTGAGGTDLFAARFSVANNVGWFASGDSPGVYGWYWGNESGGLGTPVQWNDGRAYSLSAANGPLSSLFLDDWLKSGVAGSAAAPRFLPNMPAGPYGQFRVELRCAAADCISAGFTYVQLQRLAFTMSDPTPPGSVLAAPDPGAPGSSGDLVLSGKWLNGGVVPVRWSGRDEGTGLSSARLQVGSVQVGQATELHCSGGRPGQVRSSFKPCSESASGALGLNLAQVPQGRSSVSACLDDGVSQRTCSPGIVVRHDSVAPAIDAPAMELTQTPDGSRLSLVNPDLATILAGERAPQQALTFSMQKKTDNGFQQVVSERTIDIATQGSLPVITATGITLAGDGLYRVCARLRDAAGNQAQAMACTDLTVDDALPDTRIVSGPPVLTASPQAVFSFTSDRPGDSTYECRFSGTGWQSCEAPSIERSFVDGEHLFEVRAILPPGTSGTTPRVDPTPATHRFFVDQTPPVIEVTERPFPVSDDPDAGFSWTVTDAGETSSRCRLDGGEWTGWGACRSPWSLTGLAPGAHTVEIQAKDEAGNISETTVISFYIEGPPEPEPPPPPPPPPPVQPPPVVVEVPSRKYCALTDFSIRPTANGLRASLTASRYSRFVRIQFFRDTPAIRRLFAGNLYRELPRGGPDGPVLTLKRKAISDRQSRYRFPEVNLRTIPAWYRFRGDRLIAVPRVSNEWTRCVVRYRQRLDRRITKVSFWKKKWGIGKRYSLGPRTPKAGKADTGGSRR